ncbi:MAG: type II secretion system minor pseudopilin GspJ [Pseudomonadota bacterium]
MRRVRGLTLIELLVALFVFAVMASMAYAALARMLTNSEILSGHMNRVQDIQLAMRFLESDLLQAAPRPIRDELGENLSPALRSDITSQFALEVTRSGWSNPAGLPRSTQQRVAYQLVDGELSRYHWYVLDRTFSNEAIQTILLDDVDAILFRYLRASGEWVEQWPAANAAAAGINPRQRPRAVEIVLSLADEGEITRIVEMAP